jgi:hypothetical protein
VRLFVWFESVCVAFRVTGRRTGGIEGYTPGACAKKSGGSRFRVAIKNVAAGAGNAWAGSGFDIYFSFQR